MNGTEELQIIDSLGQGRRRRVDRRGGGARCGRPELRHRRRLSWPGAQADGQGAAARSWSRYRLMFIEEPVLTEHVEAFMDRHDQQPSTPIALGERLFSRWDFKSHLGQRSCRHHPAGPLACRRHHRDAQDRRDGRGIRRRASAALSAGPDRPGRVPAARRGCTTTLSSRNRAWASTTTPATTCSTT